jgi:hypothetical protein
LSDRQLFYIFNIVLILLKLFVMFLVSGACFIAGAVLGIMLEVYWGIPFWIPVPLLILALLRKRIYSSAFVFGLLFPLLEQLIH